MARKEMVKRLWVFDLDGPLMDTGSLYDRAIDALAKVVISALGENRLSVEDVKRRQNEIDRRMKEEINLHTGKPYGLNKSRFPLSLVRTYRSLCLECGERPLASFARKLKAIGRRVFDKKEYERIVRREVRPLFRFLKRKGDKVFILTKGDERVQRDKEDTLRELGIMDFCDGFVVVPDDKSGAIRKIKQENPSLRRYCVGDTYAADVEPGIKVGYFGIHIPYALNWMERGRAAEIEALRDKERSVCFESIAWIKACFRLLENRAKSVR